MMYRSTNKGEGTRDEPLGALLPGPCDVLEHGNRGYQTERLVGLEVLDRAAKELHGWGCEPHWRIRVTTGGPRANAATAVR